MDFVSSRVGLIDPGRLLSHRGKVADGALSHQTDLRFWIKGTWVHWNPHQAQKMGGFPSNYLFYYRGFSFERNCVLRRWESETLK